MAVASPDPMVSLSGVRFAWARETVLDVARFEVKAGERVFVQGPSGSGKSTLLGVIGGVLMPQAGEVKVLGQRLDALSGAQRDAFRVAHIGFIFQLFNLLPYLSVVENVILPTHFSRIRRERVPRGEGGARAEALRLLGALGLDGGDLLHRNVTALSVGQQQRVAVARALLGSPELIVADEPTSSLDADMKASFLDLMFRECERSGATVIFVSHDSSLGERFDRTVHMRDLARAA
jgi:putative ABC transport system ATP-binding protein